MNFKQLTLSTILMLTVILSINAQNGTIRGFIYNEKTGESEIGATAYLKGTTMGAASDVNGFYSITKIPAGNYTLMVTSLGFDTVKIAISIKKDEIINQKVYLKEGSVMLNTFELSAEKQEARTEVKMSVSKVTPKEIKSIPSIGGEPDIAQYLQVLPGVTFTGDQGGQLYIRGGSPIQNKVLLDGMIIYNPFHSIGLFSVFDTDILKSADIYTGGFNAEYGGRISSIMDITTKDGDKNRLRGKVSASTFSSKLTLEGPVFKSKKDNGGATTFVLSAKHSYLNESSELYKPYFESLSSENARGIDTAGLPYNFTDIYGKITFGASNGSKFSLFGFNFKDGVDFPGVSNLKWNSSGGGGNFVFIPASSRTLIEGIVAISNYEIVLTEADESPRRSEINGFNIGMDFTSFSGDNQFKYGFEVLGFGTDFQFTNSVGRLIQQKESTTELAGFLTYRINKGKSVIEPGLRVQHYASLGNTSVEPRFGYKYNLSNSIRLKLAAGMYSQNLISANSDRDIVNLFYGFLSGPDNLPENFTNKDGETKEIGHKLQKANHLITGFELDVAKNVTLNVEGYKKWFTQLTNTNRNQVFNENDPSAADKADIFKKEFIIETGEAYGIDFSLNYKTARVNLNAIYSLSKVDRWDGITEYNPVFDRRHNVNLVGIYTFGKGLNWEFSARWNLGSGFPFTQTQGYYEGMGFSSADQNYTSSNGDLTLQLADLNQGRLPYYHRLDMSLKRKFVISKNSILEANVGVTNVYNRNNIFYVNRVTAEEVYQLPLLPSFGLNLTF
ncbi:MAG TPA: TonB-dependent receptor [Vicingaceae bacterium]